MKTIEILMMFVPMFLFFGISIAIVFLIIKSIYERGVSDNALHDYKLTAVNLVNKYVIQKELSLVDVVSSLKWLRSISFKYGLETYVFHGVHFVDKNESSSLIGFSGYLKNFKPFYSNFRLRVAGYDVDLVCEGDEILISLNGKPIASSNRLTFSSELTGGGDSRVINMLYSGEQITFTDVVNLVWKPKVYSSSISFRGLTFQKNNRTILNAPKESLLVGRKDDDFGTKCMMRSNKLVFDNIDKSLSNEEYLAMLAVFFYYISTTEVNMNVVRAGGIHSRYHVWKSANDKFM